MYFGFLLTYGGMMERISLSGLISDTALTGSVLVCDVAESAAMAVWCRAGASKPSRRSAGDSQALPTVSHHTLVDAEQAGALLKKIGSDCPVVLVLPRSQYLTREFSLPVVSEDEVAGMVALEAEAAAPPGMNEIEVAYRPIGDPADGQQRYEVFFARRSALAELLAHADELGLVCDRVVPNSVLLEWLLGQEQSPQMLVYASGPEHLELAAHGQDGRIVVRSLGDIATAQARILQVVGEMVRAGQADGPPSDAPISVAWLGHPPDPTAAGSDTTWLEVQSLVLDEPSGSSSGGDEDSEESGDSGGGVAGLHATYLGMLGMGLLDPEIRSAARQVDLMPQARRHAKLMRRVVTSGIWAGGGFVAALLLVSLGLWLFAGRYEDRRDQLVEQVRAIEGEGRQVSHRIDQLDTMHDTWDRRNLMRDVLAALYAASPQGVEYHQVEVKEDGSCYLRGQAQSVALPFELPEQLQAQAIFTDVTLADAGQARRGAGTVTEFRIDCRITPTETNHRSGEADTDNRTGSTGGAQ